MFPKSAGFSGFSRLPGSVRASLWQSFVPEKRYRGSPSSSEPLRFGPRSSRPGPFRSSEMGAAGAVDANGRLQPCHLRGGPQTVPGTELQTTVRTERAGWTFRTFGDSDRELRCLPGPPRQLRCDERRVGKGTKELPVCLWFKFFFKVWLQRHPAAAVEIECVGICALSRNNDLLELLRELSTFDTCSTMSHTL